MIAYIKGEVILKEPGLAVVKTGGLGYEILVSEKTGSQLFCGEETELFTYLDVGERSLRLYGFKSKEELGLFKDLRDVSGVGPKAALYISSIRPPEEIKKEIMAGNEKILDDIPGIGPKKAKKIILELSGKLLSGESQAARQKNKGTLTDEAAVALQNLGFKTEDIKKAFLEIPKDKNAEEKISLALKILGKQ